MILLPDAISCEELNALLRRVHAGGGVSGAGSGGHAAPITERGSSEMGREASPRGWHYRAMWRGVVQEWHAAAPPLTLWLDLARRAVDGSGRGRVFWVGRVCWPHVPALVGGALQPVLLERSIFIHTPTGDEAARVWAMDLLLRRARAAVVIGDGRGLSMAGSRRLQLAAEASGALMLLWRTEPERGGLSVAPLRWHVVPRPSERPHPGWWATLFRCKEAAWEGQGAPSEPFALEFRGAQGVVDLSAELADRAASPPMDPSAQRTA